ncbi:hypothetical protein Tco_0139937 [Tanacetum coccineum]
MSWKPYQGYSLNLPDHRYKRRCCRPIHAKLNSLPHTHTRALRVNHLAFKSVDPKHPQRSLKSNQESHFGEIVSHIQCVGSDIRPPMLDRSDFESWQQRIRLETLTKGAQGALHLGPEHDRVFTDLTPEEKERFVTAVKLNRGLKTSNYDQLYAYLKQHEAHANENKMMLERYNQHTIDPLAFNVYGRQNRGHGNYARGAVAAGNGGDNVFQVDQCDAFDFDVDEAPTAQTMFIENLSSADPIYDETGPSYDSDILSENKVVNESLTAELARYKEQVEIYEKEQVKTIHALAVVHDSEDTPELVEITRKKMLKKVKIPQCVDKKVKIAPPDYSKENYLATFTPQRHLTLV